MIKHIICSELHGADANDQEPIIAKIGERNFLYFLKGRNVVYQSQDKRKQSTKNAPALSASVADEARITFFTNTASIAVKIMKWRM
jgi:hypothetical protein